jgi:hypothetical protein
LISSSRTSTTAATGTGSPILAANLVPSNSFANIRTPCGLFWNFTT